MAKDVIIACDFSEENEVYEFLNLFQDEKPFVKIGMELFYSAGPSIVKNIKDRGHKIFLDLKCHDIPNTVRKTMKVLGGLGVDICNLHAAGTVEMMKEAKAGLEEGFDGSGAVSQKPLLIAVTMLTSTDEKAMKEDLLIDKPIEEVVMHYAKKAKEAGLDGVVCSPLEAKGIHEELGEGFITVTPGVRFADSDKGDQKRVMTPEAACLEGSDYIVVGRPITQALDPVEAYRRAYREFMGL